MLLCVGEFFSNTPESQQEWEEFASGKEIGQFETFYQIQEEIICIIVPLPTFILGPSSTEHAQCLTELSSDGGELCANLTCLGESSGVT